MRSLFLGFLLLPLLVGCGAAKGKVSGQVRFHGAPVPGGWLTFQPADPKHNAVPVLIDPQGHYEATLPVGEVRVSVDNRELEPASPRAGGVPADLPAAVRKKLTEAKPEPPPAPVADNNAPSNLSGKYVRIPSKYYDVETSSLQFKVEGGNQEHDIELKDGP